jgi:hypothetical protein
MISNSKAQDGSELHPPSATRRRLRFSLRALLLVVTLGCLALGSVYTQVVVQAARVKALVQGGVFVELSEPTGTLAVVRRYAAMLFGEEGFYDVVRLHYGQFYLAPAGQGRRPSSKPVTDGDLACLSAFRKLSRLNLTGTQVTDNAISYLVPLESLHVLVLDNTSISDAAVPALTKMRNLQLLQVVGTRLTGRGLEQLRQRMPWCRIDTSDLQIAPRSQRPTTPVDRTLLAPSEG